MTPKDREERFEAIAAHGCVVCDLMHGVRTECAVHHAVGLKYRATGKRASDRHTFGLCHAHHQGSLGIHTMGLRAWERAFYMQEELLEYTDKILEARKARH